MRTINLRGGKSLRSTAQILHVIGTCRPDDHLPNVFCTSCCGDPLPTLIFTIILGFTMIAATGPFTTSDNLEMGALRDLMEVVKQEKPDLLVLV